MQSGPPAVSDAPEVLLSLWRRVCGVKTQSQEDYLSVEGLPEPGRLQSPHTVLPEKLHGASLARPLVSFIKLRRRAS